MPIMTACSRILRVEATKKVRLASQEDSPCTLLASVETSRKHVGHYLKLPWLWEARTDRMYHAYVIFYWRVQHSKAFATHPCLKTSAGTLFGSSGSSASWWLRLPSSKARLSSRFFATPLLRSSTEVVGGADRNEECDILPPCTSIGLHYSSATSTCTTTTRRSRGYMGSCSKICISTLLYLLFCRLHDSDLEDMRERTMK